MNKKIHCIFKHGLSALCSIMLIISLPLHAMEGTKPAKTDENSEQTEANELLLQALLERWANRAKWINGEREPVDLSKIIALEKLRLSAQKRMSGWQTSHEEKPKQDNIPGYTVTLSECISDIALVPYTDKILIGAHNKLIRFDTRTKSMQTLTFSRPIARLIQSTDGSLCAILLIPNKNERAEIQFINSCKSTFELNADIEAISYYRTNDYEITQEADLSADGHFLATINSSKNACVYNLKTKKQFPIPVESNCYPCFSVHFLKKNDPNQTATQDQDLLALHSNLKTSLHSVGEESIKRLCSIDHKKNNPTIDYLSRQGAWRLPGMLIVLLGDKLKVYAEEKSKNNFYAKAKKTFNIDFESDLRSCFNNDFTFMEKKTNPNQICIHNILTHQTKVYSNPHDDTVFLGQSNKMAFIARNKELLLVFTPENTEESKKDSSEKN